VTGRRAFLAAAGGGLLAWTLAGRAQQPDRTYRLGMIRLTRPTDLVATGVPLAMREIGYVEGRNLVVEARYAEGSIERLPALARELVERRVDVIVAVGTAAVRAARDATTTIPIVLFGNFDPVAAGLVTSLARPGGNVTGVLIAPEGTLAAKKLELLKEAVPRATRMALLAPDDPNFRLQAQEVRNAAAAMGIALAVVEVRGGDYERAFAAIVADRAAALFVGAHTLFSADRRRIIDLAAKHRLPAIYEWPEQVEDGGLMSYGGSLTASYRRVAAYVDRLFKGAKPGDLPIDQPSKLEFVINLRTAKALGLGLPSSLLLRADRVIE
jgi:putative ABC transport system substrate-binding protein